MIAIIAIMVFKEAELFLPESFVPYFDWIGFILLWISTALTVVSGIEYIYANRKCINYKD